MQLRSSCLNWHIRYASTLYLTQPPTHIQETLHFTHYQPILSKSYWKDVPSTVARTHFWSVSSYFTAHELSIATKGWSFTSVRGTGVAVEANRNKSQPQIAILTINSARLAGNTPRTATELNSDPYVTAGLHNATSIESDLQQSPVVRRERKSECVEPTNSLANINRAKTQQQVQQICCSGHWTIICATKCGRRVYPFFWMFRFCYHAQEPSTYDRMEY